MRILFTMLFLASPLYAASAFAGVFDDKDGCDPTHIPLLRKGEHVCWPVAFYGPIATIQIPEDMNCPVGWDKFPTYVTGGGYIGCKRQIPASEFATLPASATPQPQTAATSSAPPSMKEAELAFQNFMWWVGTAFEVVFALIALIVIFVLYLNFSRKSKERSAWANLPAEGPMKVNITEEDVPAGSFDSKRFKCTLKFDIQISQADWKAIASMGLMQHVLFTSPAPSGDMNDPNNIWYWKIEDLKRGTNAASFHNTIDMHEAKEKLIENLHNLRSQIDARKYGDKKETMEI
jgi:hypothetical protein